MKGVVAGDLAAPLALDAAALSGLKQQAKDSPKAALSAAATQFEALFVQMLLKSMRDALPQDGMLQSDTSKMYTSMFDQQIAQQMSKRGIGLRQILEKQLAPALAGGTDAAAAKAAPAGAPTPVRTKDDVNASTAVRTEARARYTKDASGYANTPASGAHDAATARVPANVRSFVEKMRPYAEAAAKAVGVPADLLLAQAGLETGWGRSQPKTTDGAASHNLFGVKAGRGWNGPVSLAATTEYVAGAIVRTVDRFRSYASYTDAFQDFGRMLTRNGRYAAAVARSDDPVAYAKGLQHGGYATDPQYADKLVRAIRLVTAHTAQVARAAPAQVIAQAAVNRSDETAAARTST